MSTTWCPPVGEGGGGAGVDKSADTQHQGGCHNPTVIDEDQRQCQEPIRPERPPRGARGGRWSVYRHARLHTAVLSKELDTLPNCVKKMVDIGVARNIAHVSVASVNGNVLT
jgi:hypothetical protein